MSSSREGPNPLRPYYIPPSIGLPPDASPSSSNAPSRAISNKNAFAASYASAARDAFIEIDYSDYVSEGSQSTLDTIKGFLDQAVYKYLSVLLAQPFENAKTVLQVRSQAGGGGSISLVDIEDKRQDYSPHRDSTHEDYLSDESDTDEPAYFTSSAPSSLLNSPSGSRRRRDPDRAGYVAPGQSFSTSIHQLMIKRPDSIIEALSQLWTKEGTWGLWKGTNATFMYSVLFKTVESWTRSMIAAVVNVPDPGLIVGLGLMVDCADSPYPWVSLGVAVIAAGITGILLAPLDIVRTKLILVPTSTPRRGYLHNLGLLHSYFCPPSLVIPTFFHSTISPLMTQATSLLLRSRLSIDPVLTPLTFSLATFCASAVELFLKLPCETVLRRGQMAVISSPKYLGSQIPPKTIINPGAFRGFLGTMWLIVREEGYSETATTNSMAQGKKSRKFLEKRGQGIDGLWRGWRVGIWGLIGVWGAAALGGASTSGGEF